MRECTWNGRPDGPIKGDTARVMLEQCLLLQVHLQEDWRCRTAYVRTISLALMTWQPWMSRLPGCVFVEESCEAMNSRLAGTCRSHPAVTDFEGVNNLYLLLDPPSAEPHHSRGRLRTGLVLDMVARLRALIAEPSGRAFPLATDATRFRWVDGALSRWTARGPLPRRPDLDAHVEIFRAALWTVTSGRALPGDVTDWLTANVPRRPEEEVDSIDQVMDDISRWRRGSGRARRPRATPTTGTPAVAPTPASQPSQEPVDSSDDEYVPGGTAMMDTESVYEPPGSDLSADYVSPGWTDDTDLSWSDASPSPAVTSGDEGLD